MLLPYTVTQQEGRPAEARTVHYLRSIAREAKACHGASPTPARRMLG